MIILMLIKILTVCFPIDRVHELAKDGFIKLIAPVHIDLWVSGRNQEKFRNEIG